ncbi:hypothetical protein [Novipirellula sp.]|uniref:hypothetical protein n=1 Tax=Novipirellula sp. TaxID=2795430 RepID=UPI00356949F9
MLCVRQIWNTAEAGHYNFHPTEVIAASTNNLRYPHAGRNVSARRLYGVWRTWPKQQSSELLRRFTERNVGY